MERAPKEENKSVALRYALATLAVAMALLLRKVLAPLLGTQHPYIAAWPAIVFSAWYCGIGPSTVSILVSVLGIWYFFIPTFESFRLQDPKNAISGMALFAAFAGLIVALGEANRRSKARSEQEVTERRRIEDELRQAQAELERRVRERTAQLNIANQSLSQETARVRAQAELLDAANDAIFVGDREEEITYWNKGAERLYGWTAAEAIGKQAHDLLRTDFPIALEEIIRQRDQGGWEGELVHSRSDGAKLTVASRWTPLKDAQGNLSGWLEINRDISDRKEADAARQLNAQLLKMQDQERRTIARELNESTGQMVIALLLNLERLKACRNLSHEEKRLLSTSATMLQSVSSELRTISHLLHPPLLDEVGLWRTLEWYIEGFKRRSGIAASLEGDSRLGRIGSDLEVAIFRVAQECLMNIQRHSGSGLATIRLLRSGGEVRLEVLDRGNGIIEDEESTITQDSSIGVGLRGMRDRIYQLGGNLSVQSGDAGTTVVATFPIAGSAAA